MFSLFRGAYGEMMRKEEFFVALLGLDGAGKTAYVERLKAHFNRHYRCRNLAKMAPTVGLNHVRVPLKDAVLNLWDLGGQAELRPLWHSYLTECHAIIFVVDSSDVQRLPEVCSALENIFTVDRICQLPLMVLFNKCDLEEDKLAKDDHGNEGGATPTMSSTRTTPASTAALSLANGDDGIGIFSSTKTAANGTLLVSAAASVGPSAMPTSPTQPSPDQTSQPIESPAAPSTLCGSGWQSFELDNNISDDHEHHHNADVVSLQNSEGGGGSENNDSWEQLSTVTTASSSSANKATMPTAADRQQRHNNTNNNNELMDRFRRQYFNNHITTRHQADVAVFSVSALHNTNVKRSVTWLISALSSTTQRHHH